mmetsp:Transcript_3850/g.8314  ORF Transcript_3850/g.8314 Transcript_3850/m.8314 type:complete len:215 (+) Transcript_3850:1324-1968(+)
MQASRELRRSEPSPRSPRRKFQTLAQATTKLPKRNQTSSLATMRTPRCSRAVSLGAAWLSRDRPLKPFARRRSLDSPWLGNQPRIPSSAPPPRRLQPWLASSPVSHLQPLQARMKTPASLILRSLSRRARQSSIHRLEAPRTRMWVSPPPSFPERRWREYQTKTFVPELLLLARCRWQRHRRVPFRARLALFGNRYSPWPGNPQKSPWRAQAPP